jgi:putative serine protease PepD
MSSPEPPDAAGSDDPAPDRDVWSAPPEASTTPFPVPAADPFAAPWATASSAVPAGAVDSVGRPPRPRRGLGTSTTVVLVAVVGVLAGLLGGVVGYVAADRADTRLTDPGTSLGRMPVENLARDRGSVAGIAAAVLPTVVSISATDVSGSGGTGSGFVIRDDGYLLTNNHVIASAAGGGTIDVTFSDGTSSRARIVGRTPTYDLAVLRVKVKDLPTATLGNSDSLVVGDPVVAVGSPLGLSGTVTTGIVSALDRPVTAGDTAGDVSYISAIQTDAAINPGNSGGPLVDARGRVVGVNSAIASLGASGGQAGSIGLGFAIPINQARRIAEELIADGTAEYPIVGVNLDLTYPGPGARILPAPVDGREPLVAGGPAALAGLQPGDVIVAVDGRPVATYEEFVVAIRTFLPGDEVTLSVRRDGDTRDFTVTLQASEG